jgi:hypothetical protein
MLCFPSSVNIKWWHENQDPERIKNAQPRLHTKFSGESMWWKTPTTTENINYKQWSHRLTGTDRRARFTLWPYREHQKTERDGCDLNTRGAHSSQSQQRGAYPCNTVEWSGRLGLASRAMEGLVPIMLREQGRWREEGERDWNKMINYAIYISWGKIP